ncbi:hypothetical protein DSM3645_03918 [Blastopirellula marina DSM 3645]|uniref:Uncharacterized protein n=1 Tax=Blastopirellula marina DSM 3645 TaxID=314230 RepID=A3ZV72_9BACT|nr:hypothetical protein DSM3645_03918 [Blastopirellula marina DSM 3645]
MSVTVPSTGIAPYFGPPQPMLARRQPSIRHESVLAVG